MKRRIAAAVAFFLCAGCVPLQEGEYGHKLAPLPEELRGPVVFEGYADHDWTSPGTNSFRGDLPSALIAQGVREPERSRLVERIRRADYDDVVCARRGLVMSQRGRELFYPGMAMTFGENTIVYNMRPGFAGEQCGYVYREGFYYEWLPYICQNPTRIAPLAEAAEYANSDRPEIIPGRARRWWGWPNEVPGISNRRGQPYVPYGPRAGLPPEVQDIPEPETAILVVPFVLYFALRSRRRHALQSHAPLRELPLQQDGRD